VIVGGLIVSQVLTLFSTPVIYLLFDGLAQRGNAWVKRRQQVVTLTSTLTHTGKH
ncbi:hypothetical protein HZD82_26460, partial [Pantoea agglomerans]|nr:hypothetical protein [Pantoea agglomerans]